jgi:hypothetical protein
MIALVGSEKESLQEVFPEQCLKATLDPTLLSNLYDFDMSLCPHHHYQLSGYIPQFVFTEMFDAIDSHSRVPELLVWMHGQVCWIIIMYLVHFH